MNIIQMEIPEAEVYHAVSTGYAGLLGITAKMRYNRPLILTEHGIYAREREEEILQAGWVTGIYKRFWIDLFYFISTGVYLNSSLNISLFEKNREIQLELGAKREKTVVIPNGVNPEKYNISKTEHDGYIITAILRVVPIKDVKTLIRAFRLIKNQIAESVLYIVGPYDEDREYYTECVKMTADMKLGDAVFFTGRKDINEYLAVTDIMILSSISEGQPLVILEAMASETAVVATDVGACRELLEGNEGDNRGSAKSKK